MIRLIPKIFKFFKPKLYTKNINKPLRLDYLFSSYQKSFKRQKQESEDIQYNRILEFEIDESEQISYIDTILKKKECEEIINKRFLEIEEINESEQISFIDTIVKKYEPDPTLITDYGHFYYLKFYQKQGYKNAFKICEIVTQILKISVSNQSISLFPFYSYMIDCCIKLNDKTKALTYVEDAVDIMNTNLDELKKDNFTYFKYLEQLALRYSDLGFKEKCNYYSSLCQDVDGIDIEIKVITTHFLIESLESSQKIQEAIQLGTKFLNEVTFEDIGKIYNETQVNSLKIIYERIASLLLSLKEFKKAYFYQDELLLLIQMTENEESQKYEAVQKWLQNNLLYLALNKENEIFNIINESEIQKQEKKMGKNQLRIFGENIIYIINGLIRQFGIQTVMGCEPSIIDGSYYYINTSGFYTEVGIEEFMGEYITYLICDDTSIVKKIHKIMKKGNLSTSLSSNLYREAEEKAEKIYLFVKTQQEIIVEILNIHKEVKQICEMIINTEDILNEELQQKLLNLIKKSVDLEEKIIAQSLIDQQFIKNEYQNIKSKISKNIQQEIEKQLELKI